MTSELKNSELKEISDILKRRANEIAIFKDDYCNITHHLGSVELALTREIHRLRRLADKVDEEVPEDDDDA